MTTFGTIYGLLGTAADPATASTAFGKTAAALAVANTGVSAAAAAQSTANNGVSAAAAAQSSANSAGIAATAAQSTANSGVSAAAAAQSTATAAQATATGAVALVVPPTVVYTTAAAAATGIGATPHSLNIVSTGITGTVAVSALAAPADGTWFRVLNDTAAVVTFTDGTNTIISLIPNEGVRMQFFSALKGGWRAVGMAL